jgi:hypothetical protein
MKRLFPLVLLSLSVLVSCNKDDDSNSEPLRDYADQYATDIANIDEFLDTHYMTVDGDFNVTFTTIPEGGTQASIRNQTDYPLQFKMVDYHDIQYKIYYLKFREGNNQRPSPADSVYVSYRGVLLDSTQFDYAATPRWFTFDNINMPENIAAIKGWQEIIPLFKTGGFTGGTNGDPIVFTDYGAGVMFLPSGMAYYNLARGGIPKYSPLIFSVKLNSLRYRDHDRDGVLSKDEVANPGDSPIDYDLDGDGNDNYIDIDDDADEARTQDEVHKDAEGNIIFEDCDGDGVPNYLDPDSDGRTCN